MALLPRFCRRFFFRRFAAALGPAALCAYAERGFTVLGVAMDERGWAAVTRLYGA